MPAVSQSELAFLQRTNRSSLVEIERKILIENHRDIARAGFHLRSGPGGYGWLKRTEAFLQLGHDAVVALNLTQPGRAFFQAGRHFVAESQELAEIVWADSFGRDAGCGAQRIRKRLVGSGQPNHSPLANGELHESQYREREYEDGSHSGCLLDDCACEHCGYL
jgi:hypothetical protein